MPDDWTKNPHLSRVTEREFVHHLWWDRSCFDACGILWIAARPDAHFLRDHRDLIAFQEPMSNPETRAAPLAHIRLDDDSIAKS